MKWSFVVKQILKMGMQHVLLPLVYDCHRRRPCVPNRVIFADAHHESRPESMEALYLALEKEGWEIVEIYRDYGKLGILGQLRASAAFMREYAGAGAVVLCDNFLPAASCRKKKETRVIQLWHGPGAFKKFGYDTADDIPRFYLGNVFGNYDLVTVSGPACVAPFTSAMRQKPGVVRPLGISRMDRYQDPAYLAACRERFYEAYPQAQGKKLLLWAPTFRGNAADPSLAGAEAIDALAAELGEEWFVLKSLHPHMRRFFEERADAKGPDRPTSAATGSDRPQAVISSLPTDTALPLAEVVITDYSSVFYDACVLHRRVLMFAPDLEEYLRARGTYLDLHEFPGAIVRDPEVLAKAVRRTIRRYDYEKQERFVRSYLSACDGHATERIVHWMKR